MPLPEPLDSLRNVFIEREGGSHTSDHIGDDALMLDRGTKVAR